MGNQNYKMFFGLGDFIDLYVSRPLSVLFLIAFGVLMIVTVINIFYAGVEATRLVLDRLPILNKTIYAPIREKVESNAPKKEIMETMITEGIAKNVIAMIVLGILIALLR